MKHMQLQLVYGNLRARICVYELARFFLLPKLQVQFGKSCNLVYVHGGSIGRAAVEQTCVLILCAVLEGTDSAFFLCGSPSVILRSKATCLTPRSVRFLGMRNGFVCGAL